MPGVISTKSAFNYSFFDSHLTSRTVPIRWQRDNIFKNIPHAKMLGAFLGQKTCRTSNYEMLVHPLKAIIVARCIRRRRRLGQKTTQIHSYSIWIAILRSSINRRDLVVPQFDSIKMYLMHFLHWMLNYVCETENQFIARMESWIRSNITLEENHSPRTICVFRGSVHWFASHKYLIWKSQSKLL